MKVYRIKHIPSGLYFTPSRHIKVKTARGYAKSNLSKRGKIYTRKPTLKYLGDSYYNHTTIPHPTIGPYGSYYTDECFLVSTNLTEWVIEEVC